MQLCMMCSVNRSDILFSPKFVEIVTIPVVVCFFIFILLFVIINFLPIFFVIIFLFFLNPFCFVFLC